MTLIRLGKHTHKIKLFTLSNSLAQYFVTQIILCILFKGTTINVYWLFLMYGVYFFFHLWNSAIKMPSFLLFFCEDFIYLFER